MKIRPLFLTLVCVTTISVTAEDLSRQVYLQPDCNKVSEGWKSGWEQEKIEEAAAKNRAQTPQEKQEKVDWAKDLFRKINAGNYTREKFETQDWIHRYLTYEYKPIDRKNELLMDYLKQMSDEKYKLLSKVTFVHAMIARAFLGDQTAYPALVNLLKDEKNPYIKAHIISGAIPYAAPNKAEAIALVTPYLNDTFVGAISHDVFMAPVIESARAALLKLKCSPDLN